MNVVYVDNPHHIGERDEKWRQVWENECIEKESAMGKQTESSLFYGFQREQKSKLIN